MSLAYVSSVTVWQLIWQPPRISPKIRSCGLKDLLRVEVGHYQKSPPHHSSPVSNTSGSRRVSFSGVEKNLSRSTADSSALGDPETAKAPGSRTISPQDDDTSGDEDSFHSFGSESETDKAHLVSGQYIPATLAETSRQDDRAASITVR